MVPLVICHSGFLQLEVQKCWTSDLDSVLGVEEFQRKKTSQYQYVSYTNIKGFIGSGILRLEMGSYGFLLSWTLKTDQAEMSKPAERGPLHFFSSSKYLLLVTEDAESLCLLRIYLYLLFWQLDQHLDCSYHMTQPGKCWAYKENGIYTKHLWDGVKCIVRSQDSTTGPKETGQRDRI